MTDRTIDKPTNQPKEGFQGSSFTSNNFSGNISDDEVGNQATGGNTSAIDLISFQGTLDMKTKKENAAIERKIRGKWKTKETKVVRNCLRVCREYLFQPAPSGPLFLFSFFFMIPICLY